MNNSGICEECNVILTHHLYAIYTKTLVCSICLDKRSYNDLNYHSCVSCVWKNKTYSNAKELNTDEHMFKYRKLGIYANTSICTKANLNDTVSSLSMKLSLIEVELKVIQKEMNESVNNEICNSVSSGILISLFKSPETRMHKLLTEEE